MWNMTVRCHVAETDDNRPQPPHEHMEKRCQDGVSGVLKLPLTYSLRHSPPGEKEKHVEIKPSVVYSSGSMPKRCQRAATKSDVVLSAAENSAEEVSRHTKRFRIWNRFGT